MKQPIRYAIAVLLVALAVMPTITLAQTATTTSSSSQRFYQEGPSESGSVRRERVRGYRQQSSELRQKIDALPSTPTASVLMPVLFGVGIKDIWPNFGDPRSGGRRHEGEDIMAVKGTPIVSPTPAVVIRTGVGETEGNYVYTANPGGETFVYMHLDRIGEGVGAGFVLGQGSLLGYVGNTGNASGGAAHLHFEIHTSGSAVDPFPRLTGEFSLQEKITHLTTILNQTSDSTALSQLLAANFRGTFIAALAANITLPLPIVTALAIIPVTPVSTGGGGAPLPAGDLDLNSSGAAVVALQRYLIRAASGAAATRLAGAGATGNFGVITKAALLEYQVAVGIAPPNGYYGPVTRAFILAHPLGTAVPSPVVPSNPPVVGGTTGTLTRDLRQSMSGEDVRTLQIILNANGYTIAAIGSGSPGNETVYFGPATEAAVIRFQIAGGIVPAVGYVGPITRAALARMVLASPQ